MIGTLVKFLLLQPSAGILLAMIGILAALHCRLGRVLSASIGWAGSLHYSQCLVQVVASNISFVEDSL